MSDPFGNLSFDPKQELTKLQAGCLLLARDLEDPNFKRSVILLCQYSAEGSYGLVINRPARMPLSEIFENVDWKGFSKQALHKVYIGGPVQPDELQVLQISDLTLDEAVLVAPKVHIGGHFTDLDILLKADPDRLRLFLGYSGWASGQLEAEVLAGAWDVFVGEVHRVFALPESVLMQGSEQVREALSHP